MAERLAYNGDDRKLTLAFDIGITYSSVLYCFLDPKYVPEIRRVTKFSGQEGIGGDYKTPSTILYGPEGEVHAKDAVLMFADYLRYLFTCTKDFITSSYVNGNQIWESKRDIVLTHSNEWNNIQKVLMQEAAIIAGVVPDTTEGRESVHFVTEGGASFYFCIFNDLVPKTSKEDDAILVIDAGERTIDISCYKRKANDSLFEEAAPPESHLSGSMFVTQLAKIFLQDFLRGSKYDNAVDDMAKYFDRRTKLMFHDKHDPVFLRCGTMGDHDPEYNIRSGVLKLKGDDMARFFEPSITCISRAIEEAIHHNLIKAVFLVGELAANDWLFNSLKEKSEQLNVQIFRPDHHLQSVIPHGAVSLYIYQGVYSQGRKTERQMNSSRGCCTSNAQITLTRYQQGIQRLWRELKCKEEELEELNEGIKALHFDRQIEVERVIALQQKKGTCRRESRIKDLETEIESTKSQWQADIGIFEIAQQKAEDIQRQLTMVEEKFDQTMKFKDKELKERETIIRALCNDLHSEVEKSSTLQNTNQGLLEVSYLVSLIESIASYLNLVEMIESLKIEIEQKGSRIRDLEKGYEDTQEQDTQRSQMIEQKVEDNHIDLIETKQQCDQAERPHDQQDYELDKVETTDGLSRSGLTEIVEVLTQEVSRASSMIIDSLDSGEPGRRKPTEEKRAQILPQVEMNISRIFLFRLVHRRPILEDKEKEFRVQMALQAIVTELTCHHAQYWCSSNAEQINRPQKIYEGLYKSDHFTVARWRSIVHTQVYQRTPDQDMQAIDTVLHGRLSPLFNKFGWTDENVLSTKRYSEAVSHSIKVITEMITRFSNGAYGDEVQEECKQDPERSGNAGDHDPPKVDATLDEIPCKGYLEGGNE
ncbi:hypothetical protein AX16_002865 [Volvariella volvacea WC 439]|nr:hypothetical protein AX16_002865 [Volvariella volvacea WC 439]